MGLAEIFGAMPSLLWLTRRTHTKRLYTNVLRPM